MELSCPDWLDEIMVSNALGGSKVILSVSCNQAVNKGEHFLSTILRATIKYKDNQYESTTRETSIILKTFPPGFLKSFIHDNGVLAKEFKMYTCVIPLMSNILGKYITPRHFESTKNDVLIMEDLQLDNFKNGNRIVGLDFDQCKTAIKVLADFHGASYIMNKMYPDILESVKKEVQFTEENKFQKQFVFNAFKIVAEEVNNWPGCKQYAYKLNNIKEKIWQDTIKEIKPQQDEINVLNHGDFWTNNILFQYDNSVKSKIINTKLIDFQFSRWTSPAIDLHIFFTISVRNKEYVTLLTEIYLSHLDKYIVPHLTKSELQQALHRTECFSLTIAVAILPMLLLDPSKLIDIEEIDPESAIDGVNNNPLCRVACKDKIYKSVFPEFLKYFDDIGLLQ